MKLSSNVISLLQKHISVPLVGLINKETDEIVLAPCLTPKVFLSINKTRKATYGYFMKDSFEVIRNCSEEELQHFSRLLTQNYVPRLADTPSKDEMSAHEFLFEQYCGSTEKSAWGGFAVTLEASGDLTYSFESGAFNTPAGQKRIKGAKLADAYKDKVINQFNDYVKRRSQTSETSEDHAEEKVSEIKLPDRSNVSRSFLFSPVLNSKKPQAGVKRHSKPKNILDSENENSDENRDKNPNKNLNEKRVSRRLF